MPSPHNSTHLPFQHCQLYAGERTLAFNFSNAHCSSHIYHLCQRTPTQRGHLGSSLKPACKCRRTALVGKARRNSSQQPLFLHDLSPHLRTLTAQTGNAQAGDARKMHRKCTNRKCTANTAGLQQLTQTQPETELTRFHVIGVLRVFAWQKLARLRCRV